MKIAVTGANGLIGSRFVNLLNDKLEIQPLIASRDFDIRDKESVDSSLRQIQPSIILHFAAKTNVDSCEEDKEKDLEKILRLGISSEGKVNLSKINYLDFKSDNGAFAVNVVGTKNLVDYSKNNNTKFLYISTDFVFDGKKDYYVEEDAANPVDWYSKTKYWGEKLIFDNLNNYIIARLAYPYGFRSDVRKDFLWTLIDLLASGKELSLIYDQVITPIFIDDVVNGLEILIEKDAYGIYHLVGDDFLSPYDIGMQICEVFSFDKNKIGKIKMEEYYQNKAKRPFHSRLKNDKLKKLGFKAIPFKEALQFLKNNS